MRPCSFSHLFRSTIFFMSKPPQPRTSWFYATGLALVIVLAITLGYLFFGIPFLNFAACDLPSGTSHAQKHEIYIDDLKKALPNVVITTRDLKATNTKGRCTSKIPGRRILINFASHCCAKSQKKNCQTGLTTGGFDICISFTEKSLDKEFSQRNAKPLSVPTGGGLWVWKPYIILKTLMAMTENDVLVYTDSGSHFIRNMDTSYVCLMAELDKDIIVFSDSHPERQFTKTDAFILMGLNQSDPEIADSNQLLGGFSVTRKTFRAIRFVGEWLTHVQDYRIVGNGPNVFGKKDPKFRGHRNDQSVVSLLAKKWKLEIFPDLSQYGAANINIEKRKLPRYKLVSETIIESTRDKSK